MDSKEIRDSTDEMGRALDKVAGRVPRGESPQLSALQESADANRELYKYEQPNPTLLEYFPTPEGEGELQIVINIPEFTSLCPKTGQPDSGDIVIKYYPDKRCVESKSLKLYIMGFRMFGEFHESCCRRILNDLVALLDPLDIVVDGEFFWRGGINIHPIVHYVKPIPGISLTSDGDHVRTTELEDPADHTIQQRRQEDDSADNNG